MDFRAFERRAFERKYQLESDVLSPQLQLDLRERPEGRRAMVQKWRDLTFLHYSVEPEVVQSKLPPGLTVDTFDGKAWVALVPFWMTGIRFPWLPAVPGTHTFPETNVRTYVHRDGKEPGVWFFSLDAANSLAVQFARRFYNLPYFRSDMKVTETGIVSYEAVRRRSGAKHSIETEIGDLLVLPQPGSLEFFLVERYLLYSERGGRLFTGRVAHPPYEIREARALRCKETMLEASGLPSLPWEHICFSRAVDVDVFSIRPV